MRWLAFVLLLACGEAPPSHPSERAVVEPSPPLPTEPPVAPSHSIDPPAASAASITIGEVYQIVERDPERDSLHMFIAAPPEPRPDGRPIAWTMGDGGTWELRLIEEMPVPSATVTVVQRHPSVAACEARVVRARRLHAVFTYEEDGQTLESESRTRIALELEPCSSSGIVGIAGVPFAEVTVRALDRAVLSSPAPIELVDLVREDDAVYGASPAAADFRALALPHLDVTIVAGAQTHLVRDGRRWSDPGGGFPEVLIEARDHAFFVVSSAYGAWGAALECFSPRYGTAPCEIVDDSGTPTNVRAGPSGRSAVVTTVGRGTTVPADDHVGSWLRVHTTPRGWVHESAVRCAALPELPSPCESPR